MKTHHSQQGFTLVELMVVVMILVVVMTCVGTVYSGGIHVYSRIRDYDQPKADAMLALARLERDIRNAVEVSAFSFKGDSSSFEFFTLVTPEVPDEILTPTNLFVPGKLEPAQYRYNSVDQSLSRLNRYPSRLLNKEQGVVLVNKLSGFEVEYLSSPGENLETSNWVSEWDEQSVPPIALKIQMLFEDTTVLDRVFFL
jgi:prepilin-type N-terminal cleavage/methylation domain-containing protein